MSTKQIDERIHQLITLGREHYNAGDYEQAENYLGQVISSHRNFPDVFNMLGVIYYTSGRFAEAEEAFESALRINPNYTEAALNLSVTYNDRGKYAEAREVYSRVITNSQSQTNLLDPFARGKLANMHADLGAVYSSMGLYEEAVREYSKALDMCPDFADLRTRLANVYREMGKPAEAIVELERVKEQRFDYLPARINLGITLFSVGRRDEALAEWRQVLESDPENKIASLYIRMVTDEHHAPRAGSALRPPDESIVPTLVDDDDT